MERYKGKEIGLFKEIGNASFGSNETFGSHGLPTRGGPWRNEDALFVGSKKGIVGVFDGRGHDWGQAAGFASQFIEERAGEIKGELTPEEAKELVSTLIREMHEGVQALKEGEAAEKLPRPMDYTTASIFVLGTRASDGKKFVIVGNVGNSPVYRIRGGEIKELTKSDETSFNQISQGIGKVARGKKELNPHVDGWTANDGDRFVMLTYGVSNRLSEKKLDLREVIKGKSADDAVEALMEMAKNQKGEFYDDVTAVVIDI